MAASFKEGLSYFPLNVDIDQDDKIYFIEAKHGPIAFAIIIKLYMRIYKQGYYCRWTDQEVIIFAKQTSFGIDKLRTVVSECLEQNLFDKGLFEKYNILTSRGIQRRFSEITKRRKVSTIDNRFCNFGVNVNIQDSNVSNHPSNADISKQREGKGREVKESKVKKSKIKKRKIKKRKENTLLQLFESIQKKFSIPELKYKDEFIDHWTEKNPKGRLERWEMEKVFDVSRRFKKWLRNKKEWKITNVKTRDNSKKGDKKYNGLGKPIEEI